MTTVYTTAALICSGMPLLFAVLLGYARTVTAAGGNITKE